MKAKIILIAASAAFIQVSLYANPKQTSSSIGIGCTGTGIKKEHAPVFIACNGSMNNCRYFSMGSRSYTSEHLRILGQPVVHSSTKKEQHQFTASTKSAAKVANTENSVFISWLKFLYCKVPPAFSFIHNIVSGVFRSFLLFKF